MICNLEGELASAREKLAGDLTEVLNLRPMPGMVVRINQACQNQQVNLQTIIELIQCEPTIVSRILSIVNSPIYGFSREINSLNQAVVVLGFRKLSQLAASIASKQVFEHGEECKTARIAIYEHCLACAATARVLAQQPDSDVDDGAAFLAGLLHDVGKLFFLDLAPASYTDLQSSGDHESKIELEAELYGKHHPDMGMEFAITNGLPHSIIEAIAHHHDDGERATRTRLTQITDLANSMVKLWGIGGPAGNSPSATAMQWIDDHDEQTVAQIRCAAVEQFQILKSMFLD